MVLHWFQVQIHLSGRGPGWLTAELICGAPFLSLGRMATAPRWATPRVHFRLPGTGISGTDPKIYHLITSGF